MVGAHQARGAVHDPRGVLQRRARRGLHDHEEISLVFLRHKSAGHPLINKISSRQPEQEDGNHGGLPVRQMVQRVAIAGGPALDGRVDPAEEAVLRTVAMAQQQGRQRGRERQRVEGGDGNGESDGQRELLVEPSGAAREQ